MHTQNFFVDKSCNGQAVKAVCEDFPQLYAMSALALVVKAVNSVYGGAFMVPSKQEKVLGVFYFVG
jgi:hypothetical protein